MTAPPKPAKRGPKPKKAIKRSPLKPYRRPIADDDWAIAIMGRYPACWNILRHSEWFHVCDGPRDAAHVISRRYAITKHDLQNGLNICRSFHDRMTRDPKEWERFCRAYLGYVEFERLRLKAGATLRLMGEK